MRWIGSWDFPLVNAPPRINEVLRIDDDGWVALRGFNGETYENWRAKAHLLTVIEVASGT